MCLKYVGELLFTADPMNGLFAGVVFLAGGKNGRLAGLDTSVTDCYCLQNLLLRQHIYRYLLHECMHE